MRLLPLAFIALLLTGCASLQRPDIEPLPATLAEVNWALEGRKAVVHFADDREPERGYVVVGPTETVVQTETVMQKQVLNGRIAEIRVVERIVPTVEIDHIDVDVSLSTGQGVVRGALYGAGTGLAIGALWLLNANPSADEMGMGSLFIANGIAFGAGIGPLAASSRDWVPVYEAPITRYPDAALVLLERDVSRLTASR